MFLVDQLILVSGVLLLLGIASSKLSVRVGVPVLVLFLVVGMLAGSEGIAGIPFEDYPIAHGIGTIALVIILFDGGLGTSLQSVKSVWKPALSLATVGVLVTAAITGLAAKFILGVSTLEGILLGSIVASTDAAAVFATLRFGGVALRKRLGWTIEIESGSNDPMAIFLTMGCINVLTGKMPLGVGLLGMFFLQMTVGFAVGIVGGMLAVRVVNRINLGAAGLYPVLISAFCLFIFGLAATLGGSGFLAVYIAGIVLGNSRIVFERGILLFHDAAAWLSQIIMFIVLGLLSFPSRLLDVAWQGLLIGSVLILIARPIAVVISLLPFRYRRSELAFISWVGLKGAVPITLATFPLLLGAPKASLIFDIVFFVVVLSAVVQGWSLPLAARWLGLEVPPEPRPPVTLEISSLKHVDGDIVDYTVRADSIAAGKLVRDLALPGGVVIAIIVRDAKIIPPQGNTPIHVGDHVILVLTYGTRPLVNRIFAGRSEEQEDLPEHLEFPLRGTTTVRELEEFYGIRLEETPESTLSETIQGRLAGAKPTVGYVVQAGEMALRIRQVSPQGVIEQVGLVIGAK